MEEQDSQDEEGNAIEKVEYEKQEVNLDEFNIEFDTLNPPIDIPNEVADHVDNDFDLPYTPPDVSGDWSTRLSLWIGTSQWYYIHTHIYYSTFKAL